MTETVMETTPAADEGAEVVEEVVDMGEAVAAIPTNDEGVLVFPASTTGVGTTKGE